MKVMEFFFCVCVPQKSLTFNLKKKYQNFVLNEGKTVLLYSIFLSSVPLSRNFTTSMRSQFCVFIVAIFEECKGNQACYFHTEFLLFLFLFESLHQLYAWREHLSRRPNRVELQ